MKKYISLLVALAIIFSFNIIGARAQAIPEIQAKNADALVTLGIMKGYEDGSLRLENKIKRSEFITWL